jgi:hypothetical protein
MLVGHLSLLLTVICGHWGLALLLEALLGIWPKLDRCWALGCWLSGSYPETGFREVAKRIGITQPLFVLEQGATVQDDGHPERSPSWLCRQLSQKASQFGRCLKLRDRIELLEGAGEGIEWVIAWLLPSISLVTCANTFGSAIGHGTWNTLHIDSSTVRSCSILSSCWRFSARPKSSLAISARTA